MSNVAKAIKRIEKERNQKEKFIVLRMWFSTLISSLYPDRTTIPENIGNRVSILNNLVVTKNSMSTYFVIEEITDKTPVGFFSKLVKELKNNVPGATINMVTRNIRYHPDLNDSGLQSRRRQWISSLESEESSEEMQKRAATLLYTEDVIERGEQVFKSQIHLILRTKDGSSTKRGIECVSNYLNSIDADFYRVKSQVQEHFEATSILSNKMMDPGIGRTVQSTTTLAELLPATQGSNDDGGIMLGVDRWNRSPYFIDFKKSSAAKNIIVLGPSGKGKTYLVISWALDFYANGFNIVIMDLKGNEFLPIIKSMGGIVVVMNNQSTQFVNTLVLDPKGIETTPESYYNLRQKITIERMKIVTQLEGEFGYRAEALISEFVTSLYSSLGVMQSNPNTWSRSNNLHPHMLYGKFKEFLSQDIVQKYGEVVDKVSERFRMFFDKSGSNSYLFLEEYRLDDIMKSKAISFDFGLMTGIGVQDETIFKLHLLDMQVINSEYARYKKSKGEWVFKILEEAQVAKDYLLATYGEEFSLRRAQNQVTVILTNSLQSINSRPESRPIIDNTNILAIGPVNKSTRDYLVSEFSLDDHVDTLTKLQTDPDYLNTFLLINRMSTKGVPGLIKIFNPDEVSRGRIYKVVDVE